MSKSIDFYKQSKQFWDNEYRKGYIYGKFPSSVAIATGEFLLNKHLKNKTASLLEIGGGYGRNSCYFNKQLGLNVSLMDFSRIASKLNRKLTMILNCNSHFILYNILKLSQYFRKNQHFNIVFHNFIIHIFQKEERKKIYREVKKVLKKGGFFIGSFLSVEDPDYDKNYPPNNDYEHIVRGKYQHFFSQKEIRRELSLFKIISITKRSDPEIIIGKRRNTHYYFVIAQKI